MIILFAFGKKGYAHMAHNLAFSIRHHSDTTVGLYIAEDILHHIPNRELFADIRTLSKDQYTKNGRIDPAVCKSQVYRLGCEMSDKFLVLDVDALCINPIDLSNLKGKQIATEVMGKGGKNDSIEYSMWATNQRIWDFFELPNDAILCGIQSSWAYFEKSHLCDTMQQWLDYYMAVGVPKHMLLNDWGGTLPDELLYQGVYAKLGIIPDFDRDMIYFGHARNVATEAEVLSKYKVLSLFGNGAGRTLIEPKWLKLYDRLLKEYGDTRYFTSKSVMADKHLNK